MPRPKIFISHSCKDAEIQDAIPLEQEEAGSRQRRLKYAKRVRDEIEAGLNARCDVLLDRSRLEPGDTWRAKLHHWLGVCDGAVILLSEDSVASDWVLKEATILAWRKSLQADLLLVPVFLGQFGMPQLQHDRRFGPLQLEEIQAATPLAGEDLSEDSARQLAAQVIQRFAALGSVGEEGGNAMAIWIENVAAELQQQLYQKPRILERLRQPLDIAPEDWELFDDFSKKCEMVAYQLFHSDQAAAYEALRRLKDGFNQESFAKLADYVEPLWVDAQAASNLLSPLGSDAFMPMARRAFQALNTYDHDLARDYVRRALCGLPERDTCCADFNAALGEGQLDEAMHNLQTLLLNTLRLQDDEVENLPENLAEYPFYIIIGEQVALDGALGKEIYRAYPQVACLVLAGLDGSRRLPGLSMPPISPLLDQAREQDATRFKQSVRRLRPAQPN